MVRDKDAGERAFNRQEEKGCTRRIRAQPGYYFATVVSAAVDVVSAETEVVSGAGAGVSTVTVSVFSEDSVLAPQDAATATINAATINFKVFFIDFGLKFPFIQKVQTGNPILEKYLPWVTFMA